MDIANSVEIVGMTDCFVLRFAMRSHGGPEGTAVEVSTVAIPLTTALDLGLNLFEAVLPSIVDLHEFLLRAQDRVDNLNRLAARMQQASCQNPSGGE